MMNTSSKFGYAWLTTWVALCALLAFWLSDGLVIATVIVIVAGIGSFVFAKTSPSETETQTRIVRTFTTYPRRFEFEVDVSGEFQQQRLEEAARRLRADKIPDEERYTTRALWEEWDLRNYGAPGVAVEIAGHPVGALPSEVLDRWRAMTRAAGAEFHDFEVPAQIRRAVDGDDGDRGQLGLWLDLPLGDQRTPS